MIMKRYPVLSILWFVVLILLVSLACGGPAATEESPQEPTQKPVEQPAKKEVAEPATPVEEPAQTGAVADLQAVRGAVIQIQAEGTFVDPQYGAQVNAGRGTGFIIDPSGVAVTNNHVVTGAALLKVWIGGDTSQTYNARVLGVSECSDLAVIDIEGDGFPYLSWYPDPIQVGLEVYTAGYPLGDPEYTLTKGIVSKETSDGETNWASVDSVLMHDATINPGNSGGPLIDANGRVVAVNYAAYKAADQYFAIGTDVAIPLVEQLRSGQDVDSLGINGEAFLTDDGFSGIWISSVASGSPADKAGVTGGDILTSIEGVPVAADGTMADYCDIVRSHSVQDTMDIEVLRFGTSELLEGQLNGRQLAVVSSPGGTSTEGTTTGTTGSDTGFYEVTDGLEAVFVEVPVNWADLDGEMWESNWGTLHFKAASIAAAPDIDAFYSSFEAPGVNFAASEDWGDIGGYVQLLDATRTWYQDSCDLEGRYDYEDVAFEGKYDLWECGDTAVVVLSSRPISDPLAYLTLLQAQMDANTDIAVFEQILATFDVVGANLP
jgi:serine protease Do